MKEGGDINIMEDVRITAELIDKEIELYQDVIQQYQSKLDDLNERTLALTERIEVLQKLQPKVSELILQQITAKNLQIVVDERFSLIPGLNGNQSNIKNYQKLINYLEEIKLEL